MKNRSIFFLVLFTLVLAFQQGLTQTVIGGSMPDASAMLDVQSNSKGLLLPRLTTTQRGNIPTPAKGLLIFNTTTVCLEINLGTPANPAWLGIKCLGSITGLVCASAMLTGNLLPGQAASGISVSVPYTGGNGGVYDAQSVESTGITGLTATLSAGSFTVGSGNLSYAITGTPSSTGTASFALNIGGQTCALDLTVQPPFSISCTDAIRKGEMQPNISYISPIRGNNNRTLHRWYRCSPWRTNRRLHRHNRIYRHTFSR